MTARRVDRRRFLERLAGGALWAGVLGELPPSPGPRQHEAPEPRADGQRPGAAAAATPGWRCLDIHTHIAGVGHGETGCFVRPDVLNSFKFRFFCFAVGIPRERVEQADAVYLELFLERLRGSRRTDQAVVVAMDGVLDDRGRLDRRKTAFFVPNDYVLRLAREHEELLAGASIHPGRPEAIDELERVVGDGAVLLKWLPNTQGIRPDDRSYRPFLRKLAELRLPLLCHTGSEFTLEVVDPALGDPRLLVPALEEGVTVIAAHAASLGRDEEMSHYDRLLGLMEAHENLYADISALTLINRVRVLRRLAQRTDLHDRLVYGSDYPIPCFAPLVPFTLPGRLTLRRMLALQSIDNILERDVEIKRALGFPDAVFARGYELIRTAGPPAGDRPDRAARAAGQSS